MTHVLRRTAESTTLLLAGCSLIWIVGDLAHGQAIAWETIGVVWLVGWPVLFVGFGALDLLERTHPADRTTSR
jgi:hypothetical protein